MTSEVENDHAFNEARYLLSSIAEAGRQGVEIEFLIEVIHCLRLGDSMVEAIRHANREWDI